MRILPEDRRAFDRRVKDRIAPILRSGLTRLPLLFIITTNIWITNEALAKAQNDKAEIVVGQQVVMENQATAISTHQFTKSELAEKKPAEPNDMQHTIRNSIGGLLKQVTDAQNTGHDDLMKMYQRAPKVEKNIEELNVAAMTDKNYKQDAASSGEVLGYVRKDMGVRMANSAREQFVAMPFVKKHMNFSLDFNKLFHGGGSEPKAQQGSVRYGLVVKDIIPEQNPTLFASTGDTDNQMMQYAGHAEVVWTVAPITEAQNGQMFNVQPDTDGVAVPTKAGVWERFIPSPKFMVKTEGVGTPKADDFMDNKAADKAKSGGLKFTMTQEQGLYQLTYQTKEGLSKDFMEHEFTIPIVGTFSVGRRFNEKMEVTRTAFNNILVDKRAPAVSLYYLDKTKNYAAAAGYKGSDYEVSFAAETPQNWNNNIGSTEGEKYEVKFNRIF